MAGLFRETKRAVLTAAAGFAAPDSRFELRLKREIFRSAAGKKPSFSSVPARSLCLTDAEKKRAREFFEASFSSVGALPFDWKVGGRSLRRHPEDWDFSSSREDVSKGARTAKLTICHKKSGLVAEVDATLFENFAAVDWRARVKNAGEGSSPVLSSFCAADLTAETGRADLFWSRGSLPAADDFELLGAPLSRLPLIFNADGGRSASALPFFNLCGKEFGAVAAVGWTGQWKASFSRTGEGTRFRAKQEFFRAPLLPGECVRTPEVCLCFYEGNALKGFNVFRDYMRSCVCPENLAPQTGFLIANEFSTQSCEELIKKLQTLDEGALENVAYFWMDAGWYSYQRDWYDGVGNWTPDEKRFPETLRPLSDAMREKGKAFLLWYEPERVREGTRLYREGQKHPGWLLKRGENLLWNLAEDGARDFLTKVISASLLENGVGVYRQDFNFAPLLYWRQADKTLYGGRTGMCENKYVTNLYKYLDALGERVPGLWIDNCASGGKRLDLEMCRRSVPLWRSDYNCRNEKGELKADVHEATQSMTHGLSFWLPYSGTNRYFSSFYAARSALVTHPSVYEADGDALALDADVPSLMARRYFPLTPGSTGEGEVLAMQFGDEEAGAALLFRRAKAPAAFLLRLSGLEEDAVYTLADADDPAFAVTLPGAALRKDGVTVAFGHAPEAKLVRYRKGKDKR